ncbi:MAG: DEAD/DEAH box helicase [Verrucomicrobiales bacterium]
MEGLSVQLTLPDLWQQQAVTHLKNGRDVVVDAPTGAGKTWVFELLVTGRHLRGQAIYTVPTRALANDKCVEWRRKGWDVGIATGDVAENVDAPVLVATLETQRERFLRGSGPALLVIDEYQMIGDRVRGLNYELAVALAPADTQLLLLSGSVANPADVVAWLGRLNRQAELVTTRVRPVPLDELPAWGLPYRAPASVKGYWPRLALEVIAAGAGPLLIFAPQRANAEKIARQLAKALPADDPLPLTREQKGTCGKELVAMLEKRVAYHHSGLSYGQRAGIIEPLAKAGQLRVVVATMGLAAGINFSMRSVLVSDTRYFSGEIEHDVACDELLQMFGRAGRRGLDEIGYVVVDDRTPRLADAAPKQLRRSNEIDWPTLLGVMHRAAEQGQSPIEAARTLCRSLFSKQRIELGFSRAADGVQESGHGSEAVFGLVPTKHQILNAAGEWETWRSDRVTSAQYASAVIVTKKGPVPALSVFSFVASTFEIGRVAKLDGNYGREFTIAVRQPEGDYTLTKNVRAWLKRGKRERFSFEQLKTEILPLLGDRFESGELHTVEDRNGTAMVLLDFSRAECPVYQDVSGALLVTPRERHLSQIADACVVDTSGIAHAAPAGTAAHAWRRLELIDPNGTPTRRGVIFSFFHHGDGLAIAAALEDEAYNVREIIMHLANIRGGHRFSDAQNFEAIGSERLGAVCRQVFGAVNYSGYLDMGLPVGYGEGTAEVLAEVLRDGSAKRKAASESLGEGDVERALVEWFSFLRHIQYAPDYPWQRWTDLKREAAEALQRHAVRSPARTLQEFPVALLNRPVRHQINLRNLGRDRH